MLFQALRHRFLWRQRAPIDPGEIRRIERWLATARVFLAISALVAVRMDPAEIALLLLGLWPAGVLYRPGRGRHPAAAAARTVNRFISPAGACGGHRVAGVDLDFRHRRRQSFFSVLCFRAGGGGLPLGSVGDGCHRGVGDFAVVAGEPGISTGFLWRGGPPAGALPPARSWECRLRISSPSVFSCSRFTCW